MHSTNDKQTPLVAGGQGRSDADVTISIRGITASVVLAIAVATVIGCVAEVIRCL